MSQYLYTNSCVVIKSFSLKDLVNGAENEVGEHALGNVNFAFTARKSYLDAVGDSLAVAGGVENVANSFTFIEGRVVNLE